MKMEQENARLRDEIGRRSYEGNVHVEENHSDKAVKCFDEAYQKCRQLNDDKTERLCAFNLGAAYIASDEPKKGLEYLHKAKPPGEERDARSNGDLYLNMAFGYEKLEDTKTAFEHYKMAHDEYKYERDNVDMQIQCLEKCLQIHQKWKKLSDAAEMCKSIAELYSVQRDALKQAEYLYEMASLLRLDQDLENASSAAKNCLNVLNEFSPYGSDCTKAGKILNDLGLVYTQLQNYDVASQCFQKALELVHQGHTESKQLEAVILQNLGAAYNFQGDYQRAIKFHEDAADRYAKLKYRNGQGQCYINLAFALSQLGEAEMKDAEIAFHHALLASKDTGDKHMTWQALEGLGAVNFNRGNFERATEHFQEALKYVGENKEAGERIVKKLRHVIEYEVECRNGFGYTAPPRREYRMNASSGQPPMASTSGFSTQYERPVVETTVVPQQHSPQQHVPSQEVPMAGEQPRMSKINEEKPRRMIPMRKKDSIGPHYPKMARGLSSGTVTPTYGSFGSPRFKPFNAGLTPVLSSESEEDSQSGSDESNSESETESEEEEDEEEEEKEKSSEDKIREDRLMQQIFTNKTPEVKRGGEPDTDLQMYEKRLQEKEATEEGDEGDSDSTTDSDEESQSDDSDDDDDASDDEQTQVKRSNLQQQQHSQMQRKKQLSWASSPPVPTQSPPHTLDVNTQDLATYVRPTRLDDDKQYNSSHRAVSPLGRRDDKPGSPREASVNDSDDTDDEEEEEEEETNPYASIDSPRRSHTITNGEGNDIIISESSENTGRTKVMSGDGRKRSNFFDSEGSISGRSDLNENAENEDQSKSKAGDNVFTGGNNSNQGDDENKIPDLNKLPRGQREVFMHEQHQKLLHEKSQTPPALPPRQQEQSKTCVVM